MNKRLIYLHNWMALYRPTHLICVLATSCRACRVLVKHRLWQKTAHLDRPG
jgi:hypothetical protein